MSETKYDLASRALQQVGARTINSFDDGTYEGQLASQLYEGTARKYLTLHPWNFAIAVATLSPLADPPLAEYDHAFVFPGDCLRVLSVGRTDRSRSRGLDFEVIGRHVYANADAVTIRYLAAVDESIWPPWFAELVVDDLASQFAFPLTHNASLTIALREPLERRLQRAKTIDAIEGSAQQVDADMLVRARA